MPRLVERIWEASPDAYGPRSSRTSFRYSAFVPNPIFQLETHVTDAVIAEIEAAPAGTEWKAAIRMQALSARAILLRHPWAEELFARQVGVSVTLMRYLEDIAGHLLGGGLSSQLAHTTVHVLGSRILGFSRDIFDPEARRFPVAIETALLQGEYPHSARIIAEATHDPDVEFAFGLDLILDGLERARDVELRVGSD